MSRKITLLIGVGLAVVLLAAILATTAFAQGVGPFGRGMMGLGGVANGNAPYGPMGMMGQMWGQGTAPGEDVTGTLPYGSGMMGGMMGHMRGVAAGQPFTGTVPYNCPMWGGATGQPSGDPVSEAQAVAAAEKYVEAYGNEDLVLGEVMSFSRNFYVVVEEKSTGTGAFELLVDRYTGFVHPEPGPNMMWNTKYGHMGQAGGMMGGMMGRMRGYFEQQSGPHTVSEADARDKAEAYLAENFPGAALEDEAHTFYGYYTFDFLQDGEVAGMLSVNGYTGDVWYHSWHGEPASSGSGQDL